MSRTIRALRVVAAIGALPATVVTPTRLAYLAATTRAIASSCPGSQSTIICNGEFISPTLTVNLNGRPFRLNVSK